jgi:A/G-specific adenine glycosylase
MPTRTKPKPKTKTNPTPKPSKHAPKPTLIPKPATPHPTITPPARIHSSSYHYPLLLDDRETCNALLQWFEGIEQARSMPWRKPWIDPATFEGSEEELGEVLGRRAYEVWVSEISELCPKQFQFQM